MRWIESLVFEWMELLQLLGHPIASVPLLVSFLVRLNPNYFELVDDSGVLDEHHSFGFVHFVSFGELGSHSQQMD